MSYQQVSDMITTYAPYSKLNCLIQLQDSYIVDTFPSASFEGNNGLCHAEYCTCQSEQTPIHSLREKKRIIIGLPFEIGAATGFVLTVIYCFMSGLSFL